VELLHKGFDALDLAYPYHLPEELVRKLQQAKDTSIQQNWKSVVSLNGIRMNVAPTGARGGYAFRCDTGKLGETWFFKKPNRSDPWGIRVSVSAVQVAIRGLDGIRAHLEERLSTLGVPVRPGAESIARLDFAMDFLFPEFVLESGNFVMNSRFGKMKHASLLEYKEAGTSGRTTSVTVGKNPNRQLIVYDKRAEVLAKKKVHWLEIWNANRKRKGQLPISLDDPSISRVWRIELRAYKAHLKQDWGVSSWGQLHTKLPSILGAIPEDIQYKLPNNDNNRSRWNNHPLWLRAKSELADEMGKLKSPASNEAIRELYRNQQIQMILDQMAGCQIALAALNGVEIYELEEFVGTTASKIGVMLASNESRTSTKLKRAQERYA